MLVKDLVEMLVKVDQSALVVTWSPETCQYEGIDKISIDGSGDIVSLDGKGEYRE